MGVARQYCGALGKIANCQVATTAALWTGTHAWLLGAQLYLPQALADTRGARSARRIPTTVRFQEKAAARPDAVSADSRRRLSDHRGAWPTRNLATIRRSGRRWHRAGLPYAVGISSTLGVFVRPPTLARPPAGRTRRPAADHADAAARAWRHARWPILVATWPAAAWRSVTWRNARAARAVDALASRPSASPPRTRGGSGYRAPEVWLLAERDRGDHAPHEVLLGAPARRRRRCARSCGSRISAGRSNSSTKNSRTNSDSITSKAARCRGGSAMSPSSPWPTPSYKSNGSAAPHAISRCRASGSFMQEVLTAHLFVTRPHYLQRMLKLQQVSLRI